MAHPGREAVEHARRLFDAVEEPAVEPGVVHGVEAEASGSLRESLVGRGRFRLAMTATEERHGASLTRSVAAYAVDTASGPRSA